MGVNGMPPRVVVSIDTLALTGVSAVDRHRVAAAFSRELTRLLRAEPGPGQPGATDLPADAPLAAMHDRGYDELAGSAPSQPTTGPRQLGEALARAVHRSLGEQP